MALLQTVLLVLLVSLGGVEISRRVRGGIRVLHLDEGDLRLLSRVLLLALLATGLLLLATAVASGGDFAI